MKIACNRCGQKLTVPEAWAGRAIRCNGCNKVMRVPKIEAVDEDAMDVDALAEGDATPEPDRPDERDWPEFGALAADQVETAETVTRVCPYCGKSIKVDDPNLEVLCSNCWQTVPPASQSPDAPPATRELMPGMPGATGRSAMGFYTGVFRAVIFPLGAAGSLLLAVGVAIAAILLPVGSLLAVALVMKQEPVYGATYSTDWARPILFTLFTAELLYFVGVAYYAFVDTVRSTLVGSEHPPDLTWNLTTVSQAFLGYMAMVLYYAVVLVVLIMLGNRGELIIPASRAELASVFSAANVILLAVLTLITPMSLIGMASGKFMEGINPIKALVSISRTAGHYTFLFILDCLYIGLYGAAVVALIGWTGQTILALLRTGAEYSFASLTLGLVLWSVLIGVGIYFAYVMGRVHGLFARAFRPKLSYDF